MTGCIVGWAHTPFGKHEGLDVEALIGKVAGAALEDAGIEASDVDRIYVGHFNAGFSKQEFPSSLVFQAVPGLRFKPATRLENACATGSAAVHAGLTSLAARQARLVLVVGVEKMTDAPAAEVGANLLKASYLKEEGAIEGGFAGIFARIAQQYFQRHGDKSDALARIAAKNHRNGVANPYAQLRKDLGYEFCRTVSDKNPMVAPPLRRTDCSLVSDGAAAVVLADVDTALSMKKAIAFRAAEQVNDLLPMRGRDVTLFEGAARAWAAAFANSRLKLDDLDLVETHDCFTIAELIEYEAMGLTAPGDGARAIEEGWVEKDGKLPVNPSGGLKAKGHPIGATGVSMHALAAMQLAGQAGGMQIAGARLAGVFNMGGAAVANYVSILEPLREHRDQGRSDAMFRALVLEETDGKVTSSIKELAEESLPEGDVTVDVTHSTLNYKDGMILKGLGRLVRQYPHVPGVDFAGKVLESSNRAWKPGDFVVSTGWRVGESRWGGYAGKARVKGEWLVRLPKGLTPHRAMAIGTAGFTAMLAVMVLEVHGVTPDMGEVLVTGAAGGLGSVAVAVLAKLGYKVAASTGRPETHDYLKRLGATTIVERASIDKPTGRPLESERWAACIDAVGGATLANVLATMKYHGAVASCGLAGGTKLETTVIPFLLRGISLLGIDSVMCPLKARQLAWTRLAKDLPGALLDSMVVDAKLADLPRLADDILAGKVRGRVVVDVKG